MSVGAGGWGDVPVHDVLGVQEGQGRKQRPKHRVHHAPLGHLALRESSRQMGQVSEPPHLLSSARSSPFSAAAAKGFQRKPQAATGGGEARPC